MSFWDIQEIRMAIFFWNIPGIFHTVDIPLIPPPPFSADIGVRNACKIKKAHILFPGYRGGGAKLKLSPEVKK